MISRAIRWTVAAWLFGVQAAAAPTVTADGRTLVGRKLQVEVLDPADQDVVILTITADRTWVYPLRPLVVTLSVLVKEVPPPAADVDPVSVQKRARPPALSIPWATDDGSEPLDIEVRKADRLSAEEIVAAGGRPGSTGEAIRRSDEGIFANVTDLGAVRDQSVRPGRWLAGLATLTGLYAATAVVVVTLRRRRGDKPLLRRRAAPARARRRLRDGTAQLAQGQTRSGVDLVQSALVGLVADAADLPEAGMTPKDVLRQLEEWGVASHLVARVDWLLDHCQAVQYGTSSRSGTWHQNAPPLLDELIEVLKAQRRFR